MALTSSPGITQRLVGGGSASGVPWAQKLVQNPNVVGNAQGGIAGGFVQGHANAGAAWAQKLAGSPAGGHGPNTQAGWQAAGYGPQSPAAPKPTSPVHGQGTASTPGPAPFVPDSTYLANVNNNTFGVNNKINALNLQGGMSDTALQTALGNLAYQQPRDALNLEQAAGRHGGLYSTVYDQQAIDLGHNYLTKENAATTAHSNQAQQRAAQITALNAGIPIYAQQQAAAQTIREATANQADKSLGEPVPKAAAKPAAKPTVSNPVTLPKAPARSKPDTRAQVAALRARARNSMNAW